MTAMAIGLATLGMVSAQQPVKEDKPVAKKVYKAPENVPNHLQDISVTIRAANSEGSGVITSVGGVNYVWTCGHVVDRLKRTRQVIDPKTGQSKTLVEFDDAEVVKELIEEGRTVGQMRFFAQVVRYSNAETGEDLALLKVRKKGLSNSTVTFYLDEKIPAPGTDLFHVGSLLGQSGSNSFTTGVVSQIGRLHNGIVYDQTTCAAFPGSSGGGVFLKDGRYMGMIVRGAGETFNLCVPIRRMHGWAKKVGVDFTMDPSVKVPTDEELRKFPVEDVSASQGRSHASAADRRSFKFLIRELSTDNQKSVIQAEKLLQLLNNE